IINHELYYYFFFFFQAEDGIRDYKVTGVQTCALPISEPDDDALIGARDFGFRGHVRLDRTLRIHRLAGLSRGRGHQQQGQERGRSEERRVGKECRSGWWRDN